MKTTQNTRRQRIDALAAIAFGRAPDGGPEKGWQRKLGRAIGRGSSAITATLALDHDSAPMDLRLSDFARELRKTIADNMVELQELERSFRGQTQLPNLPKIFLNANVTVNTVDTDVTAQELKGWRVDLTFYKDSHFLALRNEDAGFSIGITEDEFLVLDDHGEKIIRYKTLRAALDAAVRP